MIKIQFNANSMTGRASFKYQNKDISHSYCLHSILLLFFISNRQLKMNLYTCRTWVYLSKKVCLHLRQRRKNKGPLCFRSLNATVYQRKTDGNEAIVKKLAGIYSIQKEILRNVRVIKGNTSLENKNVHVNFGLGD